MPATGGPLAPRGLTGDEARSRLRQHGPNSLPEKPSKTVWRRLAGQFRSPLIYILLFVELPDFTGFLLVTAAILLSWGVAETYVRMANPARS